MRLFLSQNCPKYCFQRNSKNALNQCSDYEARSLPCGAYDRLPGLAQGQLSGE